MTGNPFIKVTIKNGEAIKVEEIDMSEIKTVDMIAADDCYYAKLNGEVVFNVMPRIIDVEVINACVVNVYFADGTMEKAVTCEGDTFALDDGIAVCVAKKLLSMRTSNYPTGSSLFNKIVRHGVRCYETKAEELARKTEAEEAYMVRIAKIAAKKKAKRERREAMERERQIEIQKEAYLRAMREYNSGDDIHG